MTERNAVRPPEQLRSAEIEHSFNEEILVRVTAAGEALWNEHYHGLRKALDNPNAHRLERDETGYTKMLHWEFAHVFGPALYSGNPEPPIEMIYRSAT